MPPGSATIYIYIYIYIRVNRKSLSLVKENSPVSVYFLNRTTFQLLQVIHSFLELEGKPRLQLEKKKTNLVCTPSLHTCLRQMGRWSGTGLPRTNMKLMGTLPPLSRILHAQINASHSILGNYNQVSISIVTQVYDGCLVI